MKMVELLPWKVYFYTMIYFRPRGYKTFFVLNSVEHEILNAHKYKNIKKSSAFSRLS